MAPSAPADEMRATVNGQPIDVERMDIVISRGRLDQTTLPDGRTPSLGNAVPRTVRVNAPDGRIEVLVGMGPNGTNAITWTYWLDESASQPPQQRIEVLVPGGGSTPRNGTRSSNTGAHFFRLRKP